MPGTLGATSPKHTESPADEKARAFPNQKLEKLISLSGIAPDQTKTPRSKRSRVLFWCGRGDSNLWPLESESNALSS